MPKLEEKAYFAGLLDGEGYIGVHNIDNKGHKTIRVIIANKEKEPLKLAQNIWHGCLWQGKQKCRVWYWEVKAQLAVKFLIDIQKYSIIKRKHINIALKYKELLIYTKNKERMPIMDRMSLQLKSLNSRMGFGYNN